MLVTSQIDEHDIKWLPGFLEATIVGIVGERVQMEVKMRLAAATFLIVVKTVSDFRLAVWYFTNFEQGNRGAAIVICYAIQTFLYAFMAFAVKRYKKTGVLVEFGSVLTQTKIVLDFMRNIARKTPQMKEIENAGNASFLEEFMSFLACSAGEA